MRIPRKMAIASVVWLVLLGQLAMAAETPVVIYDPWQPSKGVKDREEAIRQEIRGLKEHPWAGNYYRGDGLGSNVYIDIAPTNGIAYRLIGCVGIYDQNHGTVEFREGVLEIDFKMPLKDRDVATRMIPITWGERTYLLGTNDMVTFCNEVNSGAEPRSMVHGRVLLRRGDEHKPVQGEPGIPKEYQRFLLKTPLEVGVTAVGTPEQVKWSEDIQMVRVELDKGTSQGVFEGMNLYLPDTRFSPMNIEVKKVEKDSAWGEAMIYRQKEVLKAGMKLSSQAPWLRFR